MNRFDAAVSHQTLAPAWRPDDSTHHHTPQVFDPAVRHLLATAVLGGAIAMGTAHAQGPAAESALGTVTVTGQQAPYQAPERSGNSKFTAPLLDTPKSVTVITEELMKDRGTHTLQEVLRTVPGVTLGAGEGGTPMGDRPFIRGYEASTDIMVDGVRDLGKIQHEMFNIESVEIVKGPGSAYSGRGSTGGAINLQSKKPKAETAFTGSLGVGTDSYLRTTVDGNWRLNDDVALRLNGMTQNAGVAGRDTDDAQRWGFAPSVTFGMQGPTKATLSYYLLRANDMPDQGVPFDPRTGLPAHVNRDQFFGIKARDFRTNNADLATLDVSHRFDNGFELRNLLRYGKSVNRYIVSRPSMTATGGLQVAGRAADNRNETLANQLSLSGQAMLGTVKNDFSVGLEYARDEIKSAATPGLGSTINSTLTGWNPNRPYSGSNWSNFSGNYDTLKNRTHNRSVYAFNTAHLAPQWQLNTGLRYDSYHVTDGTLSNDSSFWNYQLGLVYKPAANGSIYVSYGTSSNPSGETVGQSGGADGVASGGLSSGRDKLDPEKNRSVEIGTKWNVLNDKLQLTAALFQTEKTNQRAIDPVTGDVALIGNNRTRGIELGVAGAITPRWSVFGGYTHLDPKMKNAGDAAEENGNALKYIARNSFNLWTSYKITPAFTLGGGANYVSSRMANDANSFKLPSYWRHDLMASYQVNRHLDLRLNILNVGNKTIYESTHVGAFANVAPGRAATLTATFHY